MMRIAVNGFGRIGRNFVRAFLCDKDAQKKMKLVAINIGPTKLELVAHLFKYDTLLGTFPGIITLRDNMLIIDGHEIIICNQTDPQKIAWGDLSIDWVIESSGHFTTRQKAQQHLDSGASSVLITAPATDEDVSIVMGVNRAIYNPDKHKIVSLGSCTTNALMPILKVLDQNYGIQRGMMTTVHAYTNTQVLLDVETSDPRRSRAAALNIIPTKTGAADMINKIIPELTGKITTIALRVPVAKVSLIDLVVMTQKKMTQESVNSEFKRAASTDLKNILDITYEPLVSSDFSGCDTSVIVDGELTEVIDDTMVKVFGWYDNEWAYSQRIKDFLLSI